jgi:hypothetical protein
MNYQDQVFEHLSIYRRSVMNIDEDGIFKYRGHEIPKGHILPVKYKQENILEPIRERFYRSEHSRIKYHQYFHHLNSSQAMCINLFFPLIIEHQLSVAANNFGLTSPVELKAAFEYESTLELAERKTSFDFHLKGKIQEAFVEIKYTENEFGSAKNDDEHRKKYEDTYAPIITNSPYLAEKVKNCDFFLKHYQVLRNLAHLGDNQNVVFLFPRLNKKIAGQAAEAYESFVTEKGKHKFKIVFLEDFVPMLVNSSMPKNLKLYYAGFSEKYVLKDITSPTSASSRHSTSLCSG